MKVEWIESRQGLWGFISLLAAIAAIYFSFFNKSNTNFSASKSSEPPTINKPSETPPDISSTLKPTSNSDQINKISGCSALLKSKLSGATTIRIFTSPNRRSSSFPYKTTGVNYVNVKDAEYKHINGSWFKVTYMVGDINKSGWVHESNIGGFLNCKNLK